MATAHPQPSTYAGPEAAVETGARRRASRGRPRVLLVDSAPGAQVALAAALAEAGFEASRIH
ncbi:hypothetical protein ACLEPN_11060 [Myxococcus sp. 1LA]